MQFVLGSMQLGWSKIIHPFAICFLQIHEGVKPTLQELEKFEATPEEVDLEGKKYVFNKNELILCFWVRMSRFVHTFEQFHVLLIANIIALFCSFEQSHMLLIADIIALFLLLTTIHVGNAVSFVMCSIVINTCIVYVMYSVIPICVYQYTVH